VKQPEMVGERMRSTAPTIMTKMGLEVISFTIKEVRDKNDLHHQHGRPDVARIKRDADCGLPPKPTADTAIRRAWWHRGKPQSPRPGGPGAGAGRDAFAGQAGEAQRDPGSQESRLTWRW